MRSVSYVSSRKSNVMEFAASFARLLGPLQRSFEVDRLQAGGPKREGVAIWPRGLLARSAGPVAARDKLEPSDPDLSALFGKRTGLVLAIVATADRRGEFVDDIRHRYGGFYR